MGSCMSTEATASGKSSKQSKDGGMGRLSTQYASMYREAFGRTSQAKQEDIDFFFPDMGPLTIENYRKRLETSGAAHDLRLPKSGVQIRYAWASQRGYYPDALQKENQDALCVQKNVGGEPDCCFFGVFDGHGTAGTQCATFARDKLFNNMVGDLDFLDDPAAALLHATEKTNEQLHRAVTDDTLSGTTAVTMLMRGRRVFLSNVGDSRAVAAELQGTELVAVDLTSDQTPYRKDELDRVKAAGARVLTLEQLDGLKDQSIQEWGTEEEDEGDPPRLWAQGGNYPGTAFTRSVGDSVAEEIGVIGTPEVSSLAIKDDTAFFVIASDGVWEFLTSQAVVDMVDKHADPQSACIAVCVEAYKSWLTTEARTDDITVIVIEVTLGKGLSNGAPALSVSNSRASGLGSGSVHGGIAVGGSGGSLKRTLSKTKSIRKGLARGSMAYMDDVTTEEADISTSLSRAYLQPCEKSPEEDEYLRAMLRDHTLFHLPPSRLSDVLSYFRSRQVAEGEVLIQEGQTGKFFFVIQAGTFALKIPAISCAKDGQPDQPEQTLRRYAPHAGLDSTFGSHALVSGAKPYGGAIIARSDGIVWCLEKRAYKAAVMGEAATAAPKAEDHLLMMAPDGAAV